MKISKVQEASSDERRNSEADCDATPNTEVTTISQTTVISAPVRPPGPITPEYRAAEAAYRAEQVEWLITTRDNNKPDPYGTHSTTNGPRTFIEVARLYHARYGGSKVVSQQAISKRYKENKQRFLDSHPGYPSSIIYNSRPQKRKIEKAADSEDNSQPKKRQRSDDENKPCAGTMPGSHGSMWHPQNELAELDYLPMDPLKGSIPGPELHSALGNQLHEDVGGRAESQLMSDEDQQLTPNTQSASAPSHVEANGTHSDSPLHTYYPYYDFIDTGPEPEEDTFSKHVVVSVINQTGEHLGEVCIPIAQIQSYPVRLPMLSEILEHQDLSITICAERLVAVERYALCLDPYFSTSRRLPDADFKLLGCSKIQWTLDELIEVYQVATQFGDELIRNLIFSAWKAKLCNGGEVEIGCDALNTLYLGTQAEDSARQFWSEVLHCAGISNEYHAFCGINVDLLSDLKRLSCGPEVANPWELEDETFNERFQQSVSDLLGNAHNIVGTKWEVDYHALAARLFVARDWTSPDDYGLVKRTAKVLRGLHYGAMNS